MRKSTTLPDLGISLVISAAIITSYIGFSTGDPRMLAVAGIVSGISMFLLGNVLFGPPHVSRRFFLAMVAVSGGGMAWSARTGDDVGLWIASTAFGLAALLVAVDVFRSRPRSAN